MRLNASLPDIPKSPTCLYVCVKNGLALRNHLALRDYLRNNKANMIKYGQLKIELAFQYPYDMDAYISGKTKFITDILKKTGFNKGEIQSIKNQNKVN